MVMLVGVVSEGHALEALLSVLGEFGDRIMHNCDVISHHNPEFRPRVFGLWQSSQPWASVPAWSPLPVTIWKKLKSSEIKVMLEGKMSISKHGRGKLP